MRVDDGRLVGHGRGPARGQAAPPRGPRAVPPGRAVPRVPDTEATVRIPVFTGATVRIPVFTDATVRIPVYTAATVRIPVYVGGQDASTDARPRGLRGLLSAGLELNAMALMATSGLTALFGLVFWGVAARYPADEVGRASALISTAMMMSVVASLAVGLIFTRFLGSAGPRSRAMVLAGYGVTSVVAVVLGGVFVLFFADDALFGSTAERAAFPVVVVVLALFALQDWVLIGLQATRWVPIEQLLFSGMKLALVALFAVTAMRGGIVVAWAVPAALAVLVISPVLMLRVLPRRVAKEGAVALPGRRELAALFVGEYATGATSVIVPLFMPLIVVAMLGTEANAYYALPWLVSEAVTVLLWNVSSSYITEASNDVRQGHALMRRAWRLSGLIGLAGTPFLFFGAPLLLSLLGGDYAEQGTTLLRLMAVALPFTVVHSTYVAIARVHQQMGRVVVLQTLSAAVVVALALALVGPLGVDGVGVAYLCAEALLCAITAVPLLRSFRAARVQAEAPAEPAGSEAPTEPLHIVRAEGRPREPERGSSGRAGGAIPPHPRRRPPAGPWREPDERGRPRVRGGRPRA